VKELRVADKFSGAYRSCGQVSLRQEGLYFHGKIDGKKTDLFFPIEMLPTISTEFEHVRESKISALHHQGQGNRSRN